MNHKQNTYGIIKEETSFFKQKIRNTTIPSSQEVAIRHQSHKPHIKLFWYWQLAVFGQVAASSVSMLSSPISAILCATCWLLVKLREASKLPDDQALLTDGSMERLGLSRVTVLGLEATNAWNIYTETSPNHVVGNIYYKLQSFTHPRLCGSGCLL